MIQEYKTKPLPTFWAVKFTGDNLQECKDFLGMSLRGSTDKCIEFHRGLKNFTFGSNTYIARIGDYIIKFNDDNWCKFHAIPDIDFEAQCEPIKPKPIPPPQPKDSNAGSKTWK